MRIDGIIDRVVHLEDTGTTLFVDRVGIPPEFVNLEGKRDRADGHKGPRKAARGGVAAPKKRVVLSDSDSEEEPPMDEYWGKYTESTFLKDAEKFVGDGVRDAEGMYTEAYLLADYENKDWVKTLIRALGL